MIRQQAATRGAPPPPDLGGSMAFRVFGALSSLIALVVGAFTRG